MVLAHLYLGQHDGEVLLLPMDQEDPWPRVVIPQLGLIQIVMVYLRAGRIGLADWSYLWDDSFAGLAEKAEF